MEGRVAPMTYCIQLSSLVLQLEMVVPHSHAAAQDALYNSSLKGAKSGNKKSVFSQFVEEVEMLLTFTDQ